MKKVFTVLNVALMLYVLIFIVIGGRIEGLEASKLYDENEISKADLEIGTEWAKSSFETRSSDGRGISYSVRKLSGPQHIAKVKLGEDDEVYMTITSGDVKMLIMDEQGNQMFYAPVTEAYINPGEAGTYNIYLIGKKFTGKVEIEY